MEFKATANPYLYTSLRTRYFVIILKSLIHAGLKLEAATLPVVTTLGNERIWNFWKSSPEALRISTSATSPRKFSDGFLCIWSFTDLANNTWDIFCLFLRQVPHYQVQHSQLQPVYSFALNLFSRAIFLKKYETWNSTFMIIKDFVSAILLNRCIQNLSPF